MGAEVPWTSTIRAQETDWVSAVNKTGSTVTKIIHIMIYISIKLKTAKVSM